MDNVTLGAAGARVAEVTDVLEVIFEHCGLPRLDTLKRVCKPWCALVREMPARWASATIAGNLGADGESSGDMDLQFVHAHFAVRLPDGGGLAAVDLDNARILFFSPSDLDARVNP